MELLLIVPQNKWVGGWALTSQNYGTISKCYGDRALICDNKKNAKVEECFSCGNRKVTSNYLYINGIACNNEGIIRECSNLLNMTSTTSGGGGGIVHTNLESGLIINCYNSGNLSAKTNIGGIVYKNEGKIVNCYNNGMLTSTGGIGSLAYNNSGTIISSYNVGSSSKCWLVLNNTGTIIGSYDKSSKSALVSSNTGIITNSYYYDSTNSIMCDAEGNAITINEGETEQTALKRLLQAANDALSTDEDYETKKVTWKVDANINSGYPSFIWQNKSE